MPMLVRIRSGLPAIPSQYWMRDECWFGLGLADLSGIAAK